MPTYTIRLTNSEFQSCDEPRDYPSEQDAIRAAIGSAVDVIRDLVTRGSQDSITIEVDILESEKVIARRIITVSALLPKE